MTGKTMAEHAREYRTRKAERIGRMEAALREIATSNYYDDGDDLRAIAREALKLSVEDVAKLRNI